MALSAMADEVVPKFTVTLTNMPSKAYKKPKKADWTRDGGAIGDDSMEKMEKFSEDGCGVDESIKDVGTDPNAEFLTEKKLPGVE